MTLAFTVYGVAKPKGNMKPFLGRGMKFPIVTESNRNVKSWQQLVAEGASRALHAVPLAQQAVLFASPVRLTVGFYLPRPKSLPKRRPVAHLTAPDLDKLTRCIGDALSQVVYADDAQVVEAVVGKFYAGIGEAPHVDVRVESTAGVQPMVVPAAPLPLPLFAEALP
jgi:Holliday junction resolvase RusA-like endonuclease